MKRFNCIKVCNKKMDRSKWFIKYSNIQYSVQYKKNIRFKNPMLRSDLC